ncbi:hypothetical protein FFONT_0436 [Fervidicoccus fontis Kam940]|uniref:Uncharacterized protein n=1 Tax=Fervidicoccus fontis (strain DSM 19380 / JCM 18336 / VKM B-2539 / Kam940) TaxID=1163730 RepID=I0A0B9_FERFK|nr:hypothetical protein FFONT_0436 [Fervidicoccus fontis Kam940]
MFLSDIFTYINKKAYSQVIDYFTTENLLTYEQKLKKIINFYTIHSNVVLVIINKRILIIFQNKL